MHVGLKHEQLAEEYARRVLLLPVPVTLMDCQREVQRAHAQGQITAIKEAVDIIDQAIKAELHNIELLNCLTKLRADIVKGTV